MRNFKGNSEKFGSTRLLARQEPKRMAFINSKAHISRIQIKITAHKTALNCVKSLSSLKSSLQFTLELETSLKIEIIKNTWEKSINVSRHGVRLRNSTFPTDANALSLSHTPVLIVSEKRKLGSFQSYLCRSRSLKAFWTSFFFACYIHSSSDGILCGTKLHFIENANHTFSVFFFANMHKACVCMM